MKSGTPNRPPLPARYGRKGALRRFTIGPGAFRRAFQATKGDPVPFADEEEVDLTLRAVLVDVLGLPAERVRAFGEGTELFGAMPEFDSMAVASLLTALEERLGILIEDHEIDADLLENYGNLLGFAKAKALT